MNHPGEITNIFWKNINNLLRQKKSNIYELALACGLSRRSLERSRQRNAIPDGYNTHLIAKTLGVSVAELFSEQGNEGVNDLNSVLNRLNDTEKATLKALVECYLLKNSTI